MSDFSIRKKVYYHDTDCEGVVYYANYLKYLEEARTEHLLSKGIELGRLSAEDGLLFAVSSLEIRYKAPARYGDELTVTSRLHKAKAVSLHFYQEIKRGADLLVECETRLVTINKRFRPVPLPAGIAEELAR
jgi:tol-pal system-associated acyl-CoA thioesterase